MKRIGIALLAALVLIGVVSNVAGAIEASEAQALGVALGKAGEQGLDVGLYYEGSLVGTVKLFYQRIQDLQKAYDLILQLSMDNSILYNILGSSYKIVSIIEYELEVNGSKVAGYKFSIAPNIRYSIKQLAKFDDLEDRPVLIRINKLNLIVNLYDRNWTLVGYAPIDLLNLIKENGLPTKVIAGLDRIYFLVEKKIVDPYWVTYNIYTLNRIHVGAIKVTSQGPFNFSTATRIYYESYNPILPNNAELEIRALIRVGNEARSISLRLEPGKDVILPVALERAIGVKVDGIEELLIVIKTAFYEKILNVTSDVGPIVFNPIKPGIKSFIVDKISEKVIADSIVYIILKLPFEVSPNDLTLEYKPEKGTLGPAYIVGAIEYDGLTGEERLRVYMVFPGGGVVKGTLKIKVEKAPGKLQLSEVPIGPYTVRGVAFKYEKLEPIYSTLVGGPNGLKSIVEILKKEGLLRDYREFGGASYLYVGLDSMELTPLDAVLLTLNVTYKRVDPTLDAEVIIIPIYDYIEWAPQVNSLAFLLNGTNQGRIVLGGDGNYEITYLIPVASIVNYGLDGIAEGRQYPTIRLKGIGLIFLNAKDLKVESIEAYAIRHAVSESELSYLKASAAATAGAIIAVIYRFGVLRNLNGGMGVGRFRFTITRMLHTLKRQVLSK